VGAYARLAERWITDLGVDVVGGCCGVGLSHVRELAVAAERAAASDAAAARVSVHVGTAQGPEM
jgi:hypothetical protein